MPFLYNKTMSSGVSETRSGSVESPQPPRYTDRLHLPVSAERLNRSASVDTEERPVRPPRHKRGLRMEPGPVGRSLSLSVSPRSPSPMTPDSPSVDNYNSFDNHGMRVMPFKLPLSAASCSVGPVTSHPMVMRRPPPPYTKRQFASSNSSLDSLEVPNLLSSTSSLGSGHSEDLPQTNGQAFANEVFEGTPVLRRGNALRSGRGRIQKSNSEDDILSQFNRDGDSFDSDDASPMRAWPNASDKRRLKFKFDPAKFFTPKNPFYGATSPITKRRAVMPSENIDGSVNVRHSAPTNFLHAFDAATMSSFSSSTAPKSSPRLRRQKVGKPTRIIYEDNSFVTDRKISLIESMNLESSSPSLDLLNQSFPHTSTKVARYGQLRKKILNFSPALSRKVSRRTPSVDVEPLEDGEIRYVISFPEEVEVENDFEVQRIPQYDRYLSELMNETESTHPNYEELVKTAEKISNMVKERQVEMTQAENESKVEHVQDRFPNDDLELDEKDRRIRNIQSRRRSAPSAVLLKTLSSGKSKSNQSAHSSRPLPFLADELPTKTQSTHRTYLLESPVHLSEGMQTQERYLFLFNDLLLVAKKKSLTAFKLKSKIRLSEIWLSNAIEDVSEAVCPAEKSFVIGWPTTNQVATFSTSELKDLWWAKLRSQISMEKRREEPKTIQIKILNRDLQAYASFKTVDVHSGQEANDVIKTCLEQFEIADADIKDYQIWVSSGKDPNSSYPLIGHEDIYSIKMSHVRDAIKEKGDIFILPCDTDFGSETVPLEYQVQFFFKRKGMMGYQLLDESQSKKKMKKSPIITLFTRPKTARRESSLPSSPGKFFGQRLADVSAEDDPPKPIMNLLEKLFHQGPYTQGIFRRSANARSVRELHEAIDSEADLVVDDIPILVIGDTIKTFFREMPGCVFGDDLYDKFLATNNLPILERAEELKRLVEILPRCNQKLLRHLFCVLYHIHLKSNENQMTASNLAICIGPSLLKSPESMQKPDAIPTSPVDTHKESTVVEFMIEKFEAIFGKEAVLLFGEPEPKPRQDSSTDSDSLQSSHGRLESNIILRREDSSSDSLNHDLDSSEIESSPRLAKCHLSPTNLSRDSGLTLSDSQLYDDGDDVEFERRYADSLIYSRQKRRVSDPSTTQQIDTNRLYARMAIPGNGMLTNSMGHDKSRLAQQNVTLRHSLCPKRPDGLKSVQENAVTDFRAVDNTHPDMGYLKKSASGARIFFDEEFVLTKEDDGSRTTEATQKVEPRTRPDVTSTAPDPTVSPHTFRRLWFAESLKQEAEARQRADPLTRRGTPRPVAHAKLSVMEDRTVALSRSAPVTPNTMSPVGSPAHAALSKSKSEAPSYYAPKPHLVVSARKAFEEHLSGEHPRSPRRKPDYIAHDANSSSDDDHPPKDNRKKLAHPSVKTIIASLEKSSSDTNVLSRFETAPRTRPERPPTYQEAIHRKHLLNKTDAESAADAPLNHRDRSLTRCLSDHHHQQETQPPQSPNSIKRSQSEKDRRNRLEHDLTGESGEANRQTGLERSCGKRGVFYIASTRSDDVRRLNVPRDPGSRYSTGAILDKFAPVDYNAAGDLSRLRVSSPADVRHSSGDISSRSAKNRNNGSDVWRSGSDVRSPASSQRPVQRRNSRERRTPPPDLDSIKFSEESFV